VCAVVAGDGNSHYPLGENGLPCTRALKVVGLYFVRNDDDNIEANRRYHLAGVTDETVHGTWDPAPEDP
jgi:hypothetical protein